MVPIVRPVSATALIGPTCRNALPAVMPMAPTGSVRLGSSMLGRETVTGFNGTVTVVSLRFTVSVTGLFAEPRIRVTALVHVLTGCPLIATRRSPGFSTPAAGAAFAVGDAHVSFASDVRHFATVPTT